MGAGLIGGILGAPFGPLGRIVGSAIGSGLGQVVTNKLQGRPWDEGLLFNMGLPGATPDLDYWTPKGQSDLPDSLKKELADLFGAKVNQMDNYNHHPAWVRTVPPSGAITFHARSGRVTR